MQEGTTYKIVSTKCTQWSLNVDNEVTDDSDADSRFWWNEPYSISVWERTLNTFIMTKGENIGISDYTDTMVWRGYIYYQLTTVYKMCCVCARPELNEDMYICCFCSSAVHKNCSIEANSEQLLLKEANFDFCNKMRACFKCSSLDAVESPFINRNIPDNARRALCRVLSINEYPCELTKQLNVLLHSIDAMYDKHGLLLSNLSDSVDADNCRAVQELVALYYQPGITSSLFERGQIASKGGCYGVRAKVAIPKFTLVGVYPGYLDLLNGEQTQRGRPAPKYSLLDLNCADFYNNVFSEFNLCITPFINEPSPGETSNVGWIQEPVIAEGRMSIITVKDIGPGEELLIGYGPYYPREYLYTYDAYAFHASDSQSNAIFDLWHWTSTDENDSELVCQCVYNKLDRTYALL